MPDTLETTRTKAFETGLCEIRWHGRGGQGAISSAKALAHAAFLNGYEGVTSAPTFGAERRGAPVSASTRISPETVRTLSPVEHPFIVIVLDPSLLQVADATAGLHAGGWLIVNSPEAPEALGMEGDFGVATADATRIAAEVGLLVAETPMVNTAMLGPFARTTGIVTLENIEAAVANAFSAKAAEKNYEAARRAYDETRILER